MRAYDEILPVYEQRWAERPDSYYFVPLANALRALGQPQRAIETLKQGLERYPDYPGARAALALAYFDSGLHMEAEEEAKRVMSAQPENLLVGRLLVACHREAGRLGEAMAETKRLLELAPEDENLKKTLQGLEEKLPKESEEVSAASTAQEVESAHPVTGPDEEEASEEGLAAMVYDSAAVEEIHGLFPTEPTSEPIEEDRTAHVIATLEGWLDESERRRSLPPADR